MPIDKVSREQVRIDRVSREHFPVWKRMREALYSGLDPEFHDGEMEWIESSGEAECYLAFDEKGKPIGMMELSLRNVVDGCIGGPVGYVEGIYLEPEHRRGGLGSELLKFATERFRARGCSDMATDAEIDNVDAQEFYRKVGFTESWRVVGFTRSIGPPDRS
jgi:aminoglycoside 6'-N-acetyltransferase I